jgi:hypothetical protein
MNTRPIRGYLVVVASVQRAALVVAAVTVAVAVALSPPAAPHRPRPRLVFHFSVFLLSIACARAPSVAYVVFECCKFSA